MTTRALSSQFSEPTAKNSTDRAFRVWAALAEMFGARWTQTYGKRPGPLWREALGRLTGEEVDAGLHRLLESGASHPPTLPEFLAFCASTGPSTDEIELLAHALVPSFERQTLSRRDLEFVARQNLDRARALLEGAEPCGSERNVLARLGIGSRDMAPVPQ